MGAHCRSRFVFILVPLVHSPSAHSRLNGDPMGPHMGALRAPIRHATIMGTRRVPIWAPIGAHCSHDFILIPHLRCSNGHPTGAHMVHPMGAPLMGTLWVPIWAPYGCPLQVAIYFIFLFRTFGALMGTPTGAHMVHPLGAPLMGCP